MSVKVLDAGAAQILGVAMGTAEKDTSFGVACFTDSLSVGDDGVAVVHTEPSGGGYAGVIVGQAAITMVNGLATASFPVADFLFTGAIDGGASIKGYSLVGIPSFITYFEEVFDTPVTPIAGDILPIHPRCQIGNGTPL